MAGEGSTVINVVPGAPRIGQIPLAAWEERKHSSARSPSLSSRMSLIDWEDADASFDIVVFSPSGLRSFFRTPRARVLFGLMFVLSVALTFLGIVRPMGAIDSFRFDRDLQSHQVAFIEIYVCCLLWSGLTLFLMHRGLTNMAVSLVLPWISCCLLNMLVGLPFSIMSTDPCFIIYYGIFVPVFLYFFWISMTHGLVILRMVQVGPICFFSFSVGCFVFGDYLWATMWMVGSLAVAPVYVYAYWRRRLSMRVAMGLVQGDAALYDKIWEQVSATQSESIEKLEAEVIAIEKSLGAGRSLCQDVADLSDLFAQARVLDGSFQAKLQEWAAVGGGGCSECGVKHHRRALQKTMRSYIGDASRITDLVRGSIVYDNLEELLAGLRVVVADESVHIERIKNRFARSYNSADSAGYRDVCMVLRIQSPETQATGTNQHLCELQLHISAISAVKSDEGHRRYVQWRNLRGE